MKSICYESSSYVNEINKAAAQKSQMMIASSEPVSRTYQYRKVMKPMLERKRRARINRCLDELKELMVSALQSEGENVSKLEKGEEKSKKKLIIFNLKKKIKKFKKILKKQKTYKFFSLYHYSRYPRVNCKTFT